MPFAADKRYLPGEFCDQFIIQFATWSMQNISANFDDNSFSFHFDTIGDW